MNTRALLTFLFLSLFAIGSSFAADRLVGPAGEDVFTVDPDAGGPLMIGDTNTCLVYACATIAHALGEADPGDTIFLAVGTYTEGAIVINQNDLLQDLNFVTISGPADYTDATPVVPFTGVRVDPTPLTCDPALEACIDVSGNTFGFSIQANNVTIEGLTIVGDTDTYSLIEVLGDYDRWEIGYNALHSASEGHGEVLVGKTNHSFGIYADAQPTTSGTDVIEGAEIHNNVIFELGGQPLTGANTSAGMGIYFEGAFGEAAECTTNDKFDCGVWIHNNDFSDLVVGQNEDNFAIDVNGTEKAVAVYVVQDEENSSPNRGVVVESNVYDGDNNPARLPDDNLSTGIVIGTGDSQVNEANSAFTVTDQFVVNVARSASVDELALANFYKSLDTKIWGPGTDVYFRDDGTGALAEAASEADATIVLLERASVAAAVAAPPIPEIFLHDEFTLTVEARGESASFKVSKDSNGDLNVRQGARLLFDGAYTNLVNTDGVSQVVLLGTSGDDLLTVDFNNGNPVPLGAPGLAFQAGDGFDSMTLRGDEQVDNETIEHTGVESGNVFFEAVLTGGTQVNTTFADDSNNGYGTTTQIAFDGLKPIDDVIIVNNAFQVVAQDDVDHEINIIGGPFRYGFDTFQINSGQDATFEEVNYANKKNVQIYGADDVDGAVNGNDIFTVFTPDGDAPDLMLSLSLYGGSLAATADASDDYFVIRPSADFPISVDGGTEDNADYFFLDCAGVTSTDTGCDPAWTSTIDGDIYTGFSGPSDDFENVSWVEIDDVAGAIVGTDLDIRKELIGFATEGAHPGDDLQYRVTIRNTAGNGPVNMDINNGGNDVWVTDVIDHRLSLIEQSIVTEAGTVDITGNRGTLWRIDDIELADGDSVSMTYTVIVNTLLTNDNVGNWASILNNDVFDGTTDQYVDNGGDNLEHYAQVDLDVLPVFGFPLKAAIQASLFYETEAGPRYMVGLYGGAKDPAQGNLGAMLCRVPSTNQEAGWDGGLGNLWYSCGEGLPAKDGLFSPLVVTDLYQDSSGRIWLTSWGFDGLYYSDDGGQTWASAEVDLSGAQGGAPDGLPDGFAQIYSITEDILGTLFISANNGDIYRSFDRGVTWQKAKQLPMGSADTAFAMEADPTLPGTLYAGTFGDSLYVTTDFGETWNRPGLNDLGSGYIYDIEFDPFSGNLFVGTAQGIYYSADEGDNWDGLNNAFPVPDHAPEVRTISFDEDGALFASTWGQGVWFSIDWQATALDEFALKNGNVLEVNVSNGFVHVLTDTGQTFRFAYEGGARSVDTEEPGTELPEVYSLDQNYPNPFNPVTTIQFNLPQTADVNLTVYDVLGRRVATLVNGTLGSGRHTVNFNASSLPSGMYLYRLSTPTGEMTQKMILLK